MNEKDFLEWCKQEVCDYTNKHLDKTDKKGNTKSFTTKADDGKELVYDSSSWNDIISLEKAKVKEASCRR